MVKIKTGARKIANKTRIGPKRIESTAKIKVALNPNMARAQSYNPEIIASNDWT